MTEEALVFVGCLVFGFVALWFALDISSLRHRVSELERKVKG